MTISGDTLLQGCRDCEFHRSIALPELRKQVIYLDQFFLSSAFRRQIPVFVDAQKRLADLAHQQLLVCPFSSTHELETHLWRDDKRDALWNFIKRTAVGSKFAHAASIKHAQLAKSFDEFISGDEAEERIESRDAFHQDVHEWQGFYWIDLKSYPNDYDAIRAGKSEAAASLVDLFSIWRRHPKSFDADLAFELKGFARHLAGEYLKYFAQGENLDWLSIPADVATMFTLMSYDRAKMDFEARAARLNGFLSSDKFCSTPFVDISCRVLASLRKAVRRGELVSRDKAMRAMSGFGSDIDAVSIFAPYCDAIFLDRQMKRWTSDAECRFPQQYSFRIFASDDWNAFHQYLDSIEKNKSPEHDWWLKLAYG